MNWHALSVLLSDEQPKFNVFEIFEIFLISKNAVPVEDLSVWSSDVRYLPLMASSEHMRNCIRLLVPSNMHLVRRQMSPYVTGKTWPQDASSVNSSFILHIYFKLFSYRYIINYVLYFSTLAVEFFWLTLVLIYKRHAAMILLTMNKRFLRCGRKCGCIVL